VPVATNSLGHEIQTYNGENGWVRFLGPFPDVDAANAAMRTNGLLGNGYFRLYEALDHPAIRVQANDPRGG
jgi:hypothetical protein